MYCYWRQIVVHLNLIYKTKVGQTVAIPYQNPRTPKKYLRIMTLGREWQMAKIYYKSGEGNVCGLRNAS